MRKNPSDSFLSSSKTLISAQPFIVSLTCSIFYIHSLRAISATLLREEAAALALLTIERNMVQKLEEIKGGGGSVRVGTTGTISALMTRELESIKTSSQASNSHHEKHKPTGVPVSVSTTTPKRLQLQSKKPLDEASSSSSGSRNINTRSPQTPGKVKSHSKGSHRIPILRSENVTLDRTPSRVKTNKKGTNFVEVVDIKCGHPDKAWASPITSKLRKLGFSKLSDSIT